MKCARTGCNAEGTHEVNQYGTMYCAVHRKLRTMRDTARERGKYVPSMDELDALVPDPLACPVCHLEMFWATDDRREVVSLQHWANGTISLVCYSCNARMQHRDEIPPEGYQWCNVCKENLPQENFYPRTLRGRVHLQPRCKACDKQALRDKRALRLLPPTSPTKG